VDVLVVGGGLAGLTAAVGIHDAGLSVRVIEARSFVGGRTMTVSPEGLGEAAWFDVGATWHWEDQPRMRALAAQLGMDVFPQYRKGRARVEENAGSPPATVDLPLPSPAELRFTGGAQRLCERLAARLPEGTVSLDTSVVGVEETPDGMAVSIVDPEDNTSDVRAEFVVVAIPPRLAVQDLAFTPDLPEELVDVMTRTPTWMATALKCVAVYESAFWREEGLSGVAFSEVGPLREVHDACNDDGSVAGLWGFVSPRHEFRDLSFDDRLEVVFAHLGRFFGPVASDPLRYFERDWSTDPYTADEVVWMRESLPYGHPALQEPLLGGRLFLAGTETATEGGGHMEGAIQSAQRAAGQVLDAAG
jgi:monoamine oxidase